MKMSELRELTKEELQVKLSEFKEELFNLRFQEATNRLENPMRMKTLKKDVARIKTLLTERDRSMNIRGTDGK
ncbi:MAG: 50S ribosomal protein L29 [Candidatus Cloacimonetes bacterium]|nr:50S ribosomal protein L29 [Candidatus Cloacimonadota bacterium]